MIGGFSHGDIANVGDAMAKHLVEEAKVAEYADGNVKQDAEMAPKITGKRSK